jgi:DNA primase catalytic core
MPKISETIIAYLKSSMSLIKRIEQDGVQLKRVGANWVGKCIFHTEKTGSLVVTPSKNLFHCFGCGAAGSVIDWVMKRQNITFREAVEKLARDNNISLADRERQFNRKEKSIMLERVDLEILSAKSDAELKAWAIEVFNQTLLKNPTALAYLEGRCLKDLELIEKFHIGYSSRSLLMELPLQRNQSTAKLRERLQHIGLLRESGHEHFNNCITVPILNELGEVVEIYGRKALATLRSDMPLHLYLKGPHHGVFNSDELIKGQYKEVILCEAIFDALTFYLMGEKNVTSSYGVEGFTNEHLSLFHKIGVRRVIIAYDSDDAGQRASTKLAKRLNQEGFICSRINFPSLEKDANATLKAALA